MRRYIVQGRTMSKLLHGVVWMSLTVAMAVGAEQQRELLVNYIPPSLLKSNDAPSHSSTEPSLRILPQAAPVRNREARWNRFEAEFGLQDKQPNLIEGAKYQVDRAMFVFKDFVEHSLNFDYELNNILRAMPANASPRHFHGHPFLPSLNGARLKSDIRLESLTGRSFLGVKLILPIGN